MSPYSGLPQTKARVRAVTMPERSPVKGPGPTPVTIASTSAPLSPASARRCIDARGQDFGVAPGVLGGEAAHHGLRGVIGDERGAGHGRGVDGKDQHQEFRSV